MQRVVYLSSMQLSNNHKKHHEMSTLAQQIREALPHQEITVQDGIVRFGYYEQAGQETLDTIEAATGIELFIDSIHDEDCGELFFYNYSEN